MVKTFYDWLTSKTFYDLFARFYYGLFCRAQDQPDEPQRQVVIKMLRNYKVTVDKRRSSPDVEVIFHDYNYVDECVGCGRVLPRYKMAQLHLKRDSVSKRFCLCQDCQSKYHFLQ